MTYSNMKEAKTWIVMNNMHRYCSLGNVSAAEVWRQPAENEIQSHTHSSCPRRHCTKCDRAIIDVSLQVAENEDQIHSCPTREKEDGRVLSLAWMKPR